jgi:two-component system response regulator AtoC
MQAAGTAFSLAFEEINMVGTILVVEDDLVPRKNLREALQQEGYQVEEAADGTAAIEAAKKADFDLVLTDLKLPGADGLTVLRNIREKSPQTMVIIMTAYATVDTAVEALRGGAQDYILKPIFLESVLDKVRRLVEHKRIHGADPCGCLHHCLPSRR